MGSKLSTLWIGVMFNMAFADIIGFIKPGALQSLWSGQAGVSVTPALLAMFALLLEIPIAMIVLSRLWDGPKSRWANTAAAAITTLFVVAGGTGDLYYVFFATFEVGLMALIVWSVWKGEVVVGARATSDVER